MFGTAARERGGFKNQVQTEPLLGFLSQNVTMIMTYVAKLQGVVWSMLYVNHVVCYTSDTLTSNRTKVSPRVNDVLTPGACQALLAYTLTLGEPLLVDALFVFPLPVSLVKSGIDHYSSICIGCVTGIRCQIGLVQDLPLHSTPPTNSSW